MVFHILLPSLYGIEVDLAGFLEFFGGCGVVFVSLILLGGPLLVVWVFQTFLGFLDGWFLFALFCEHVCVWFASCVLLFCSFMLFLLLKGTMPKPKCFLVV